ncbi:MAG: NAD(P)-dependent oxidoreductase [Ginsengibacter sp.]
MIKIGLIKEGKTPSDNRVAFAPQQCKWIQDNMDIKIIVQSSAERCYSDNEYREEGIEVKDDLSECSILFGIKEVPVEMLMEGKTYFFFSHTKKMQSYNQEMLQAIIKKKITLIDYECLLHEDGARLLGFGFFAGLVGAHNGMMAYGNRTKALELKRVYQLRSLEELIHSYFALKIPLMKIAITGSGRVSNGIVEVMSLMGINEVEPADYVSDKVFSYPVYVQLKGANLYRNKETGEYIRDEFHESPEKYECLFHNYLSETDVLINGVYWEKGIPRLFEMEDMKKDSFKIRTIADITDDVHGSVPCNIGDATIEDPIYGIDRFSGEATAPYLPDSIDLMAVGNLPNELPRDASKYFGEQLIKFILEDLVIGKSMIIDQATIIKDGQLTEEYLYMKEYAEAELN